MRLDLEFTGSGLTVSSDGISLFHYSRQSLPKTYEYLEKTFGKEKSVDMEVFFTVVKALKAARESPDFLVQLVIQRYRRD